MEHVRWGTGPVVLLAGALVLGGCADVDKGKAKGADFTRAMSQRHGPLIEDIGIAAENALPWVGSFDAKVTLLPTASPADLEAVESTIADLVKDPSDSAVVWANGIEICPEGAGPRAQHLGLRAGLFASSASLRGELSCEEGYAGELADLSADIAVVQPAIAQLPDLKDLPITGSISAPAGDVGGLWREVPPRLAEAITAVDAADLNDFELNGTALAIGVQPGLDLDRVRAAVAAVDPKAVLTLTEGTVRGSGESLPAGFGGLRADLMALPGVENVRFTSAHEVVVRVATPTDVAPTVASGLPLVVAVAQVKLHVTTQASDTPRWTVASGADFEIYAGQELEHLEDFAALTADRNLSAIGWREGGGRNGAAMVTISAPTGGDLRKVLPAVKEHVPVGATLNLHLGEDDYYFDVAPRLESEGDGSRALPKKFVEIWNALP
ncbi:hypothetical protein V6K52_13250 [Knoellia sp. S7-12]|uniref:hypothetical protein n=1 Tax=Knoellia sp. S7-12 TaxID=3126698 RepID=UPI003365C639